MYRKDAPRHIVRDVRKRMTALRQKVAWADWRMALIASQFAHPEWFRHGVSDERMEPQLRDAGVDMSEPDKPLDYVMNIAPDE
jgi:hypothetical protein